MPIAMWALLWGEPHNLKQFVDANQGAATAAAALLVVAVGLLVDSVRAGIN